MHNRTKRRNREAKLNRFFLMLRVKNRRSTDTIKGGRVMEASTKDKARGTVHEIKGTVKQTVGRLTNNADLVTKGRGEKIAGKVQKKMGSLKKVFGK